MRKKRILVAPLDWGLGHATRCIPIIHELLVKDVDVIVAADNRPAELLKKEFPKLQHLRFPGYGIVYPINENMAWTMFRQLPILFKGIANEHAQLEHLIDDYSIDAVISDNRWGAYSTRVPSIYIVSQLRILLSQNLRWGQFLVDAANKKLIAPYTELWIPDVDSTENFLGDLTPFSLRTKNTFFIGPLSRFFKPADVPVILDILIVLSGPEPQRTIFEEMLIKQLQNTAYRTKLVRGIPEDSLEVRVSETVTMVNSMKTDELTQAMASARTIVSRPGYSTIMDLSSLGANPIFVPTPQQTEQEYLAKRLKERNICYSETQDNFSLERAMREHQSYTGFSAQHNDRTVLRQRIDHLLESIS